MIKIDVITPEYQNLIGWKQHYDTTDIELPAELLLSETGEFFQQTHAALALDNIQATLPPNYELADYLKETVKDSVNEMLNDVIQYRKMKRYGKSILDKITLLNRYGWVNDLIVNQNRFVGFMIKPKGVTGLSTLIEEIGVQLSADQTLPMYLYHTSKEDPIEQFDLTANGTSWDWTVKRIELQGFQREHHHGGAFVIGYYQEDLVGQAVNYSNFDFEDGECGTCRNTRQYYQEWQDVKSHFHIMPMYVPNGSYLKGKMFNMEDSMFSRKESFGLNFKFTVKCDLTDFFVEEKLEFRNLLKIKVAFKIMEMMKFSQQINQIEENLKMMIIRDLEGDVDSKLTNMPTRYNRALKAVAFDMSGLNTICLPCEDKARRTRYGVIG